MAGGGGVGILGIAERDEMALAGNTALKMLANFLDRGRILRASAERCSARMTIERGFIGRC